MESTVPDRIGVPRRRRLARRVLVVYWLALFALTHWPRLAPPPVVPHSDKVAHLLSYGLLAWLYFWYRSTRGPLTPRVYAWGFLLLAAYGAVDEWLQIPVGRSCELLDWVADTLGALLGTGLFMLYQAIRRQMPTPP